MADKTMNRELIMEYTIRNLTLLDDEALNLAYYFTRAMVTTKNRKEAQK